MIERVLVAGATGYLGGFVVAELARRGLWVRALARPGKKVKGASEVFEGEATRPDTLTGVCDGIHAVFSSLGITRQTDKVTFRDVDYGANKSVLAVARAAGVERFGFVSVVSPELFSGSALTDAREAFVAELRAADGIEPLVIRSTGFFNDLRAPFDMALKGRVYLIGDGNARINPIHGADLAKVVVDALLGDQAEVSVGGPETYTWNEIAALVFEALNKRVKVGHVPVWLTRGSLGLVRVFKRRTYDIASFVRIVSSHDVLAPPTATTACASSTASWRPSSPQERRPIAAAARRPECP